MGKAYRWIVFFLFMLINSLLCYAFLENDVCYERTLIGSIGSNLKIHMNLAIRDNKITGTYFYDKYKKEIEIYGSIDEEKNFTIEELGETGIFKGKFLSPDRAEGVWVTPQKTRELPFWIKTEYIKDPVAEYVRSRSSMSFHDDAELFKIVADFNNDGLLDYCVSETSEWSNSNGGLWEIYCQVSNGVYFRMGSLYSGPHSIAIQPFKKGMVRLVQYWHMSAIDGGICEIFITQDGIKSGRGTRLYSENMGDEEIKSDKPFGIELFAVLNNNKYKPVIKRCLLADYLNDSRYEWDND
jgi:hypothetical protein